MIKKILLTIAFLVVVQVATFADEITLSWDANLETDIVSYTVHYGFQSEMYVSNIPVGKSLSHTLNLNAGVYYFAVTAEDSGGNISDVAYEIRKVIKLSSVTGFKAR